MGEGPRSAQKASTRKGARLEVLPGPTGQGCGSGSAPATHLWFLPPTHRPEELRQELGRFRGANRMPLSQHRPQGPTQFSGRREEEL